MPTHFACVHSVRTSRPRLNKLTVVLPCRSKGKPPSQSVISGRLCYTPCDFALVLLFLSPGNFLLRPVASVPFLFLITPIKCRHPLLLGVFLVHQPAGMADTTQPVTPEFLAAYNGQSLLIVAGISLTLCVLLVGLRFFCRLYLRDAPIGWDDYLMVPAIFFQVGMCILAIGECCICCKSRESHS